MVYQVKDKADFDSQLQAAGDKLVVVDFFATWCGPCKMIAPKLEELSTKYAEKVIVLKVDVNDCEEVAMEYNISGMPTFVFIKNSNQIYMFTGANYDNLAKRFEKYAGSVAITN